MKKIISVLLIGLLILPCLILFAYAYSDPENGDWSQKSVVLRNTSEAELVVRVGDIDACNDANAVSEGGYNPLDRKSTRLNSSHL